MYYNNGNMRRGGCATCAVGNNTNFRNAHSPSFYNKRNFINEQDDDVPYNLSLYNARYQRILTPPRNFSNYDNRLNIDNEFSSININNFQNYYSPARNTGCKNCSISSSKINTGTNYRSPFNGNYMNRKNNLYTFNNKMNYRNDDEDYKFRKNYYENNKLQKNDDENDDEDDNYNFRKRSNNNNDDDSFENILNDNTYRSPQRKLVNSFSTSNINNYSNINIFTRYNNFINNYNNNKNEFGQTMLNNKYRNFLNDNIDKYNYNHNNKSPQRRNYYSPTSLKQLANYKNNKITESYYLNSRYKYLLPKENNYSNDERFLTLSIYNYQRELREILQDKKSFFICIYGTHDYTGKSWCSDCNIAMPIIEEAKNIIKDKKYEKDIYFINIPIDKINMDYLRDDLVIQLERVPTLIYFENGLEKNRLIENELFSYHTVKNFILQAYEQFNLNRNNYFYRPNCY